MERDANIYGADDTNYAEGIARDALDTSMQGIGTSSPDIWGSEQDPRAVAKANVGAESTGPDDPNTPLLDGNLAGGGDKEPLLKDYPQMGRFPRHVPGPKTSTDEGGGITQPPPRNQTGKPGRQAGPVYNKKVS